MRLTSKNLILVAAAVGYIGICFHLLHVLSKTDMSLWSTGEHLINYQSGFVRRGLLGELYFFAEQPLLTLKRVQLVLVFMVMIAFPVIVATTPHRPLIGPVIIAAFFGLWGISDFSYSGWEFLERKEVWFYLAMSLLLLFAGVRRQIFLIAATLIFCIFTLIHELFAVFFIPAFFYLLWRYQLAGRVSLVALFGCYFSFFLLVISFSGSEIQSELIKASYLQNHQLEVAGAIDAIGWSLSTSIAHTAALVIDGSITYWLLLILLNVALLFWVVQVSFADRTARIDAYAVTACTSGSMFVAMISGWDWGRWISMQLLFTLYFYLLIGSLIKQKMPIDEEWSFLRSFRSPLQIATMLFFATFMLNVKVPHCCDQREMEFGLLDDAKDAIFRLQPLADVIDAGRDDYE